jgi:acetylornithine deacetylase/succinyl-diaminopimelate desuccinylase-like protein
MQQIPQIQQFLHDHRQRFEQDLCRLLRFPSVSADSRCRSAVHDAAAWLTAHLAGLGLTAELLSTDGHPIVYAESPPVDGAPTVLVYGHYDVQPPDPLDLWISPPFEPSVRDGNVYARGATDDKGQMLTHVHSAEAWLETVGALPVQLKFLLEGEEEVGSTALNQYLDQAAQRLACDVIVISDMSQFGPGQPAITYGLRGIAYYELRLQGPQSDLHSGSFGGAVTNPANAAASLLAALVDDQGRIQVPGFYDDVVPIGDRERQQLAALPFDEVRFRQQVGVSALGGEAGFSTLERRWARPSLDVNGIWGGYQGEGGKTVLPARAGAKFSFRLVPDQRPEQITAALQSFLTARCPPGIEMELTEMHSAPGVLVPLDNPYLEAAARAVAAGFGRAPVMIREGGSIPIVTAFRQKLGVDALLLGWGLDDDNMHAPNEKFSLADYHRGIHASALLWHELSGVRPIR